MIETRTEAVTPHNEQTRVEGTEEVADAVFVTRLSSPIIAKEVDPGQFVQIRVREESTPLLRIPLSVAAANEQAGTIDVMYEVVGPKTGVLSRLGKAESVACLGPLGNSFPAPRPDQTAVLIGGGVGLPPLLFFGHSLTGRGHKAVDLMVGARTAAKHLSPDRLHLTASTVAVATDDGSAGHSGLVTELLEQRLADTTAGDVIVYTCGPHPMMRAVAAICTRSQVSCFASLEEYMACGYGVCVGCVVETLSSNRDRSEYERYSRICVDGPVYDAASIIWD